MPLAVRYVLFFNIKCLFYPCPLVYTADALGHIVTQDQAYSPSISYTIILKIVDTPSPQKIGLYHLAMPPLMSLCLQV